MMLPSLAIYTDRLPADVGGQARGPLVLIRPRYRNDVGLHAHEAEHVRQWYIAWAIYIAAVLPVAAALGAGASWLIVLSSLGMIAHGALYRFVRRYRAWCEARAYAIQTQHPDAHGQRLLIYDAADMMAASHYDLGITPAHAAAMIASQVIRNR